MFKIAELIIHTSSRLIYAILETQTNQQPKTCTCEAPKYNNRSSILRSVKIMTHKLTLVS
jgi:hypothetical protein